MLLSLCCIIRELLDEFQATTMWFSILSINFNFCWKWDLRGGMVHHPEALLLLSRLLRRIVERSCSDARLAHWISYGAVQAAGGSNGADGQQMSQQPCRVCTWCQAKMLRSMDVEKYARPRQCICASITTLHIPFKASAHFTITSLAQLGLPRAW